MNLGNLVNTVRTEMLRDFAQPYLWGDEQLVALLNEAETLFARHTHVLRDDESDLTQITTEAGKDRYTLSPAVIHIADIWDDTGRSLRHMNRKKLPRWPGEGKPAMYAADAAASSIRVYPVPDDEYALQMLVARKPLRRMARERDEPEIPEEYHRDLLLYVAWRALVNNGPEGADTTSAAEYQAEWKIRLRDVKREVYHERMGHELRVRPNVANR